MYGYVDWNARTYNGAPINDDLEEATIALGVFVAAPIAIYVGPVAVGKEALGMAADEVTGLPVSDVVGVKGLLKSAGRKLFKRFGKEASEQADDVAKAAQKQAQEGAERVTESSEEMIKVHRGTSTPEPTQVGRKYRNDPSKAPSGDKTFLDSSDAELHKGAGHPEGVSVSTSQKIADKSYGTHTIDYEIPKKKVYNRLPDGDPVLGEKVFKGSIPDKYRIGTRKTP